jgi:hypothetical protein
MRKIIFFLGLCLATNAFSQELNCNVVVDAQQTGNDNVQVFKTLERQIKEFVNTTKWTDKTYKPQERIECSMVINIQSYDNDVFQATIQVQSSRPVFGSSYNTPIYNYNDKDFRFKYLEFQNFIFNENQFESNLISVIAFHVYMILGIDADTFQVKGGEDYLVQARTIVNYSQQGSAKGWKLEDGLQSRFALIDNMLSPTYKEYRSVMYNYHINGLDVMHLSPKNAKANLAQVFSELETMNRRRPNSFLMRVFFDAKSDEVLDIFSGGPSVNITQLVTTLNRIAPTYSSSWQKINF